MSTSTSGISAKNDSIVFDSDVLIWALRGNRAAAAAVERAATREVSVVSRMELIHGALDKHDLRNIQDFLGDLGFRTVPLTQSIGQRALEYLETSGLATSLGPIDALIAATCVENRLALCTGNVRHFRVIRELELRPFKP
jgi:predicted nucleic acid-binding protein